MGKSQDLTGNTSNEQCGNNDLSDRPLKKARFVWEIKGKYHLKKSTDNKVKVSKRPRDSRADEGIGYCEKTNVTSKGDCSKSYSNSCVDLVNLRTPPSYTVSSNSTKTNPQHNNDRYSRNWHLRKWQARQFAKGFVDNTINMCLEELGFVPLVADAVDLFDEIPSINENDGEVEDEAVLMAINRHGLQRTPGDSHMKNWPDRNCVFSLVGKNIVECNCTNMQKHSIKPNPSVNTQAFHHRPSSSWSDDSTDLSTFSMDVAEIPGRLGDICTCVERKTFSAVHMASLNKDSHEDSSTESNSQNSKCKNVDHNIYEHKDFMDKAVAVAIQKKGLSTLSCGQQV